MFDRGDCTCLEQVITGSALDLGRTQSLSGAGHRHAALLSGAWIVRAAGSACCRDCMPWLDRERAGGCLGPVLPVHAPSEARACPSGQQHIAEEPTAKHLRALDLLREQVVDWLLLSHSAFFVV